MLNVAYRNCAKRSLTCRSRTISADDLQLIVPNLHRRYSGRHRDQPHGGAETRQNVSRGMARFRMRLRASRGWGLPISLKFWRRRAPLIWHARRNDEMIAGVLLRALGWPLKLVFTSAAQRHHTWLTRWLIRQMDAIIATQRLSASFLKREATVVMHGVDTDRYAPPADRAAAFAESGLPGRYAIGCFGRVRAQKGTRCVRGGDVPAAAALSGFHRRHRRRDRAGAAGLCE